MSMFHIASVTVGAGGQGTITLSNIPQQYTHLQLRVFGKGGTVFNEGLTTYVRPNDASGTVFAWHRVRGNGSTAFSDGAASSGTIALQATVGDGGVASIFGSLVLDILDYTNTNKNKTLKGIGGMDRNGSGNACLVSGLWMSTNAITSLVLDTDGGWLQNTRVDLYGITTSPVTGA